MNSTTNFTSSPLNEAVKYIYRICPPIFLLIGVPGNLLSLTVWVRRIRTTPGSTCLFLAVMCGTDTYVLAHGCLRVWLKAIQRKYDLRFGLSCSAPLFIFTFLSDVSVWIIILLCIERTVCVWKPMSSKQICCIRHGSIALGVVFVGFATLHLHFFWTVAPFVTESERFCDAANDNYKTFLHSVWPFLDFAFYSFVPLALILLLNMMILIRLHKSQRRLQQGQGRSTTNRSGKILRTVVWMAISHFACTMPIVIYFLAGSEPCKNDDNLPICDLIESICVMLQLTNHFTHFFIYSLTSTLFANDLARMFSGVSCIASLFRPVDTDLHRRSKVAEEFEFRVNGAATTSRLKSINAALEEQLEPVNVSE